MLTSLYYSSKELPPLAETKSCIAMWMELGEGGELGADGGNLVVDVAKVGGSDVGFRGGSCADAVDEDAWEEVFDGLGEVADAPGGVAAVAHSCNVCVGGW